MYPELVTVARQDRTVLSRLDSADLLRPGLTRLLNICHQSWRWFSQCFSLSPILALPAESKLTSQGLVAPSRRLLSSSSVIPEGRTYR